MGRSTTAPVLVLLLLLPVAAVAAQPAAPADEGSTEEEAAIIQILRQSLVDANATTGTLSAQGWQLGDPALLHPCQWAMVECNEQRRIVSILVHDARLTVFTPGGKRAPPAAARLFPSACQGPFADMALPPELSRLRWLEELRFAMCTRVVRGIPAAWGQPGAFPRLKRLSLQLARLEGQPLLPDILLGALPQLRDLFINARTAPGATLLPDSWGGSPAVLPALDRLSLMLSGVRQLPPAWSQGFHSLSYLSISSFTSGPAAPQELPHAEGGCPALEDPPPAPPPSPGAALPGSRKAIGAAVVPPGLPPQWAAGFPSLSVLRLTCMGVGGSLPREWQQGGFPVLSDLMLTGQGLSGSLPASFLQRHPWLEVLLLDHNKFYSSMPAEWAQSTLRVLKLGNNSLTGQALPSAWILPGAWSNLQVLLLSGNPCLAGSLPANLSWPGLNSLKLSGTGVEGTIPSEWCNAPFANTLATLRVDGTAVDPTLPPCAVHSMPLLWQAAAEAASAASEAPPPPAGENKSAWVAAMVCIPLAVACCSGWLLWQRRQRPAGAWAGISQHSTAGVFGRHSGSAGRASDSEAAAASILLRHQQQRGKEVGILALQRRARLEALLGAHLSSGLGGRISLVPVNELPARLAHRMGLGGTGSAAPAQVSAAPASSQPRSARWPVHSWLEGAALLTSLGGAPVGDSAGGGAPSRQLVPGSAGWSLGSTSMCLEPDEIEFVRHRGGLVVLGEGAHCIVYLAVLHGEYVAVKAFDLHRVDSDMAWREVALLQRCSHERVIALRGIAFSGPGLLLVAMELKGGGSLREALQDPGRREELRWEARGCQVAIDVAEALDVLHNKFGVLHSDLKCSNVLLSVDMRACLCDLGVSTAVGSRAQKAAGYSCTHAAPEQLIGERCTLAADVYSFGVLLIELTTLALVDRRGGLRLPQAPRECPPDVLALIQECRNQDPLQRPSAAEVLRRLRLVAANSEAAAGQRSVE